MHSCSPPSYVPLKLFYAHVPSKDFNFWRNNWIPNQMIGEIKGRGRVKTFIHKYFMCEEDEENIDNLLIQC